VAFAASVRRGSKSHFMALAVAEVKVNVTSASVSPSSIPSAASYEGKCDRINSRCQLAKDLLLRRYRDRLNELEQAYLKQKAIFEAKAGVHQEEAEDVDGQAEKVAAAKMDVTEAQHVVDENAHCPEELDNAKAELAEEEAIPNDSPSDIDRECDATKKVLAAQLCMERLRQAEQVLGAEQGDHKQELGHLEHEQGQEDEAHAELSPQKKITDKAKAAWEAWKSRGPPSTDPIEERCDAKKDSLLFEADRDVQLCEDDLAKEKRILDSHEKSHVEEKAEADAQEDVVDQESVDVKKAKAVVRDYAQCPPELERAQKDLAKEESTPNETPSDIDRECELTKLVLEKQACVDALRDAEAVLSKAEEDHKKESAALADEAKEAIEARKKLPPQEKRVAKAQSCVRAAERAREGLRRCGPASRGPVPEPPADVSSAPPKKLKTVVKSGATRATSFAALLALGLLSGASTLFFE